MASALNRGETVTKNLTIYPLLFQFAPAYGSVQGFFGTLVLGVGGLLNLVLDTSARNQCGIATQEAIKWKPFRIWTDETTSGFDHT